MSVEFHYLVDACDFENLFDDENYQQLCIFSWLFEHLYFLIGAYDVMFERVNLTMISNRNIEILSIEKEKKDNWYLNEYVYYLRDLFMFELFTLIAFQMWIIRGEREIKKYFIINNIFTSWNIFMEKIIVFNATFLLMIMFMVAVFSKKIDNFYLLETNVIFVIVASFFIGNYVYVFNYLLNLWGFKTLISVNCFLFLTYIMEKNILYNFWHPLGLVENFFESVYLWENGDDKFSMNYFQTQLLKLEQFLYLVVVTALSVCLIQLILRFDLKPRHGWQQQNTNECKISIRDFNKYYNGFTVIDGFISNVILENVDLEFGQNDTERVAILNGENGSGKSSLMKSIVGLEDNFPWVSIITKGRIAYLGDDDICIPKMKVLHHFEFLSLMMPHKEEIMIDTFQKFELVGVKNEKVENLSCGQKRLLSLFMVLMLDADIYLLDEPFLGVHIDKRNYLMENILLYTDKKLFIASHTNYTFNVMYGNVIFNCENGRISKKTMEEYKSEFSTYISYGNGTVSVYRKEDVFDVEQDDVQLMFTNSNKEELNAPNIEFIESVSQFKIIMVKFVALMRAHVNEIVGLFILNLVISLIVRFWNSHEFTVNLNGNMYDIIRRCNNTTKIELYCNLHTLGSKIINEKTNTLTVKFNALLKYSLPLLFMRNDIEVSIRVYNTGVDFYMQVYKTFGEIIINHNILFLVLTIIDMERVNFYEKIQYNVKIVHACILDVAIVTIISTLLYLTHATLDVKFLLNSLMMYNAMVNLILLKNVCKTFTKKFLAYSYLALPVMIVMMFSSNLFTMLIIIILTLFPIYGLTLIPIVDQFDMFKDYYKLLVVGFNLIILMVCTTFMFMWLKFKEKGSNNDFHVSLLQGTSIMNDETVEFYNGNVCIAQMSGPYVYLLGNNGIGKSRYLECCMRQVGDNYIVCNGRKVVNGGISKARKNVSYCPSENLVCKKMICKDIINYTCLQYTMDYDSVVDELLKPLKLTEKILTKPFKHLSSGTQRKVMFVIVYLKYLYISHLNCDTIFVLDELTKFIDVGTKKQINHLIENAVKINRDVVEGDGDVLHQRGTIVVNVTQDSLDFLSHLKDQRAYWNIDYRVLIKVHGIAIDVPCKFIDNNDDDDTVRHRISIEYFLRQKFPFTLSRVIFFL